ncbi:MAG: radical SAM protein [Treponema sp.]|nr:radical SAM protein [Treponema sp.]
MHTKYAIKNVGWTLGNDCPNKCRHCYSRDIREKGKNLNQPMIDRVISQIEKLNADTVNLGGNEPIFTNGLDVSQSMLPYILQELHSRHIAVGLTTSGISLIQLNRNYPASLALLNDVDISLDSPFAEEHNQNRRGNNIFQQALEALDICKENHIDASIILCAMRWNFTKDRLSALVYLAREYGVNIRINIMKPISTDHIDLVPTREQVWAGYAYLFDSCDVIDLSEPVLAAWAGHTGTSGCPCGTHSLRINSLTPDGRIPVSPCVYMHDYRAGDILTEDIFDILSTQPFQDFRNRKQNYKHIAECADCEKSSICRGGCLAMAYTYQKCKTGKGDLYAIDPFCSKDIDIPVHGKGAAFIMPGGKLVHQNYLCTWIGRPKNTAPGLQVPN